MSKFEDPLTDILSQHFELDFQSGTGQEVVDLLANRISSLMAGDLESLMSMLYRLDVAEDKIQEAFSPDNPVPPNVSLAHLIIERQLRRMKTKQTYQQEPLDDWIDF